MRHSLCESVVAKEERCENDFSYTYELILREGRRTADYRLPLYSVKVSMTDPSGRNSQKEVKDVFINKDRAMDFFNKLVRNLATPIDLGYVLEDEVIN